MSDPGRRGGGWPALFRAALRAYPEAHRARFADAMEETAVDRLAEARRRGRAAAAWTGLRTAAELAASGLAERLRPSTPPAHPHPPTSSGAFVDALAQDLRFAVRALARRPFFTTVAVTTLALGVGANTAIFSVVRHVLLRPLPYPEPDGLALVWAHRTGNPDARGWMSRQDLLSVDSLPSIEAARGFDARRLAVRTGDRPELVPGARVVGGLLEVFGLRPAAGRDLGPLEFGPQAPLNVVVGWDFWQDRLGGRADAVGSTVELSERSYQVVGVAPRGFDFPAGAQLWYPDQNSFEGCGRGCHVINVIARVPRGAEAWRRARADLDRVGARLAELHPRSNAEKGFHLESLEGRTVGDVRAGLWLLLGAVGLVLLIACANVANLLLVRASTRTGEIAVRTALGAGRGRIVRGVLVESGVVAVGGGILGVLLAAASLTTLERLATGVVPRVEGVSLDGPVLLFALTVTALVALAYGVGPALHTASRPAVPGGAGGPRAGSGRREGRVRSLLLAAEVALSLVLLTGAGLLLRSFQELYEVDMGYEAPAEEVLRFTVSLPFSRYGDLDALGRYFADAESRLAALPGVVAVGSAFGPPLGSGGMSGGVGVEGRPEPAPGSELNAEMKPVTPGYRDVLGLRLVRGRWIAPADDASSPPVAVVNETFVRENFPGADPLGRRFRVSANFGYTPEAPLWEIVGVVGDVRTDGPRAAPVAEAYVPHAQFGPGFVTVHLRVDGEAAAVVPGLRDAMAAVDPQVPLRDVETLSGAVAGTAAPTRLYLVLLATFAALAALLSAVGLYGVVAYVVSRQTREIGIRMALGARGAEIRRMVFRNGARPALLGMAVGMVVVLAGMGVMEALLFGVAPDDPWALAGGVLFLGGVTAAALAIPARRATRVDPAVALRSE